MSIPFGRRPDWKLASRLCILIFAVSMCFGSIVAGASERQVFQGVHGAFTVETVTAGLNHPWAMAFVSEHEILITERDGALRVVKAGELVRQPIKGLPEISAENDQGGLLDIALDPRFRINRRVCFSYAAADENGRGTNIACGHYRDNALDDVQVIFSAAPKNQSGRHFGSRLLFADGFLYATLGDRGVRPQAQDLGSHPGSVIRILPDGRIPEDNPFINRPGALPEIYTFGNRNPQGLTLNLVTGEIWMHEHGPRGGDELNRMIKGANYGWPVISYGKEYFLPKAVGQGTHQVGMQQPVHYWTPSIAPSGMTFYHGKKFPAWRNSLFIGSLKFQELVRLELKNGVVVTEEKLLSQQYGRIRDVRVGPDDALYVLTDAKNGKLLKIMPTP